VRRRRFLAGTLAVVTPLAAGCARPAESEEPPTPPEIDRKTPTSGLVPSLPVSGVKSKIESGIESAPASVPDVEAFEAALDERGVRVVDLKEYDEFLSLTHGVDALVDEGVARSIGVVAGVYAAFVAEADDPVPLSVTLEREGSTIGEYAVASPWAEEYLAGETTTKEFAEKVRDTVKTKTK
jgi:hypothetical protein